LVLKETPFLVWAFSSVLQQHELRERFQREVIVAQSLGHGARASFLRIVLPQLLQRSFWPIIAVFSYGMTVVDMALVIGPLQPPTLAQLVWTDLNDGYALTNQRGAAGTLLLSLLVVMCFAAALIITRTLKPFYRAWLTRPARTEMHHTISARPLWLLLTGLYFILIIALVLQSVSTYWPFPDLHTAKPSLTAWARFLSAPTPIITTVLLAASTSAVALAANLLWFETQRAARDRVIMFAALIMLCVPALLVALGQYRLLLQIQLTGHAAGLFLVHLAPVTAYVFIMLKGPYRNYDNRWQQAAHGLGQSRGAFLCHVKWPMLKAPILSALAIGFAVSVAQYIPAQLAAAGRYTTLPMEAVTLSSGGNRALIATSALLLMLLPLITFQTASWFSKPRWSKT
jgi:putative thiamine transport system permease protein